MPGMPPSHEAGRLQGIEVSLDVFVVQPVKMASMAAVKNAMMSFFMVCLLEGGCENVVGKIVRVRVCVQIGRRFVGGVQAAVFQQMCLRLAE
jgi:hypothetical protein